MVQLGLFPVLAATVKFILIQMHMEECLGRAPIPDSVHSHGVLMEKQPFVHSSSRERRGKQCRPGHYSHPYENHCCILCPKGTYVSQYCTSEDKAPICTECPENSFMDVENFAEACRGCQSCYTSLNQVALINCSSTQDTVCGCPSNHYQTDHTSEFSCKPCSTCHNGTTLKECSTSSDTVCKCRKEFFLEAKMNSCFPCSSCRGDECKEDCQVTNPSKVPPDSSELKPILYSMIVVLAFAVMLLAARSFIGHPFRKKLISVFSACSPNQQPPPADLQLPPSEVQVTSNHQDPNQKEKLLPSSAVPIQLNAQRLPDCIQAAGETQIPDSPAVLYAVVEHVPLTQWKEFVRRLGLSDNDIGRIQVEEWVVRDAQYKMLRHWRLQMGQRATVERMSSVLNEMELSGCSEAIQDMLAKQA